MRKFILVCIMILSLLSACTANTTAVDSEKASQISSIDTVTSEQGETEQIETDSIHTLFFKDDLKSDTAEVTFFNSKSGKSEAVEMKKISEDDSFITYSCEGDTSVYNMAYITCGDKTTFEFAFNKCVSGWCRTQEDFFPYTEGEEIDIIPKFDDVTLKGYGFEQVIHIWKPDDYDADSDEKYSTLYVLDGQNIADFGISGQNAIHCPGVIEQVRSAAAVNGTKTIVVAIETYLARDFELMPDLTASTVGRESERDNGIGDDDDRDYDSMDGTEFADFIANILVPYVQTNYNVYTDARHTSISGNSLGGLESFYITMEYPNIFGTVGAISPSFLFIDEGAWSEYLNKKTFNDNSPILYFYTGPSGSDTDPDVTNMYNRLKEMGYPENKLLLHFNEKGTHDFSYWRSVFSEYLTAAFFGDVEALRQ